MPAPGPGAGARSRARRLARRVLLWALFLGGAATVAYFTLPVLRLLA